MSKHTPGPWFVSGSMTKYVEARIDGGIWQEVAACGPTEADNGYGEQQQANANLIAATPDLLEALEGMLDRYTGLVNCGDCGSWDPESEVEVITARKAIARAKGQSK